MPALGCHAGLDPASSDIIKRVCAGALIIWSTGAGAQSILEDGTRTAHTLRQEPHRAAICVARNIDRHSSGYLAQIKQGVEPALVEIQIRALELAALAQFLLAPEGSTALIWTTPERAAERDALVAAMIEGC